MTQEEKNLFEFSQYEKMEATEVARRLQDGVDAYKAKISEVNDVETLKEEEKELVALLEENDERTKGVTYKIPSKTVYEGVSHTRSAVANKIIYFLSRIEQSWQYVLGLHQLVQVWKDSTAKEITHGALDSTLRLLDQQKYKGDKEWLDILIINEFMKPMHEEYAKNIVLYTAMSQFHNAVVERMDLVEKVETQE